MNEPFGISALELEERGAASQPATRLSATTLCLVPHVHQVDISRAVTLHGVSNGPLVSSSISWMPNEIRSVEKHHSAKYQKLLHLQTSDVRSTLLSQAVISAPPPASTTCCITPLLPPRCVVRNRGASYPFDLFAGCRPIILGFGYGVRSHSACTCLILTTKFFTSRMMASERAQSLCSIDEALTRKLG